MSRVTQGVTLMRTRDARVVDLAVVEHEEETEENDSDEETDDVISSDASELTVDGALLDPAFDADYVEEDPSMSDETSQE